MCFYECFGFSPNCLQQTNPFSSLQISTTYKIDCNFFLDCIDHYGSVEKPHTLRSAVTYCNFVLTFSSSFPKKPAQGWAPGLSWASSSWSSSCSSSAWTSLAIFSTSVGFSCALPSTSAASLGLLPKGRISRREKLLSREPVFSFPSHLCVFPCPITPSITALPSLSSPSALQEGLRQGWLWHIWLYEWEWCKYWLMAAVLR